MKKISNYIRFGKGRGLRFVFLMSLLLSLLYGGFIAYTGLQLIKLSPVEDFVQSVPTFTVANGIVQDKNIRWRSQLPMTPIPVTIDTTQEDLSLPVADGVYLTSKYLYSVSQHGTEVQRSAIQGNFVVRPVYLKQILQTYIGVFAISTAIVGFLFLLLAFLLTVAFGALIGLIIGAKMGNGRIWRVSAVIWFLFQILSFVSALLGLTLYTVLAVFAICVVLSALWLRCLTN